MREALAALLTVVLAGVIACTPPADQEGTATAPILTILLVDRSRSVSEDAPLYDKALGLILESTRFGDRLVAGWITERSGADFRSYLDHSFPEPLTEPSFWQRNEILYKRKLRQQQQELERQRQLVRQQLQALLEQGDASSETHIIESLWVCQQLFHSETRRRKRLIILSDMLEESEIANFARDRLSKRQITELLEKLQGDGLVPDLTGVEVYVAGAVAHPLELAESVQQFWLAYFQRAGAHLAAGAYSRAIPQLAP